jgi:chemotaxis protein CheZ
MTTQSQNHNSEFVQRIGHLTRMVRVSMQELGLNREIEKAAQAIPDTRDRLAYIATMTEQAANRVLNSIERISPLQKEIKTSGQVLAERIAALLQEKATQGTEEALLLGDVQDYLSMVNSAVTTTQAELQEITMAQDFQDLTGQVVKKMIEVIKEIEHQLVQVLLESSAEATTSEGVLQRLAESEWDDGKKDSLLNGPQIKPTEGDAVTNQDQVDDLLSSMGF